MTIKLDQYYYSPLTDLGRSRMAKGRAIRSRLREAVKGYGFSDVT